MRGGRRRGLGEGGGPPSATRSIKRRRHRGSKEALAARGAGERQAPLTPAAAHVRSTWPAETGCRPSRSSGDRRTQSSSRTAAADHDAGTGHLGGLLHGHERHGDVRPRSTTSRGSVGATPNARSSENIASSTVTTRRPRRALFGEVVLDNPTSVRDRCRCSRGAGSARWVSAAGEHAPMCTIRPHPSISRWRMGGRSSRQ